MFDDFADSGKAEDIKIMKSIKSENDVKVIATFASKKEAQIAIKTLNGY